MNNRIFFRTFSIVFFLSFFCFTIHAQTFNSAGEYLSAISKEYKDINTDMWDYTSAVANGKSARKVESRRRDILKSNMTAQKNIAKLGPFKGDATFRDSVLAFLKLSYNVLNYDYAKIVDMEDIAEQSYDAMEAYLLAQEKANEKMDQAGERLNLQQRKFADKYSINLRESEDKTVKKLESAGKVFKYYNSVYLIFFKPYKQEAYLIDALRKNNINAMEQNLDALGKFSQEGLKKVDTLKPYGNDASLKNVAKEIITFYKEEADGKFAPLLSFTLKKEKFEKIKAQFDAKPQNNRTKEDVDEYNKAVADYNNALNEYNNVNKALFNKRNEMLEKWNDAGREFLKRHVPKYKG